MCDLVEDANFPKGDNGSGEMEAVVGDVLEANSLRSCQETCSCNLSSLCLFASGEATEGVSESKHGSDETAHWRQRQKSGSGGSPQSRYNKSCKTCPENLNGLHLVLLCATSTKSYSLASN